MATVRVSHTPGPWKIFIETDEKPPQIAVIAEQDGEPEWICDCGARKIPLNMTNARLIAAAPELLEALIEVVRISDRNHIAWDAAHKAIAKARGES